MVILKKKPPPYDVSNIKIEDPDVKLLKKIQKRVQACYKTAEISENSKETLGLVGKSME